MCIGKTVQQKIEERKPNMLDFPGQRNYNVVTFGQGGTNMRARVVKIGNSKGIRIPKPLLEQTGIMNDVDLEVENNRIIIRPVTSPRNGWENAFRTMAQKGDDVLVMGDENISHSWDEEEWQW